MCNRDNSSDYPTCKIKQTLKMTITEIDVDTEDEVGSYEEDYDVDEVQISVRDYMKAEICLLYTSPSPRDS